MSDQAVPKRTVHVQVPCTLLALFALGVNVQAQPPTHQTALEFINRESKLIAFFMHPSATFRSVTFETPASVRGGGFCVHATFHFQSQPIKRSIRSSLMVYFDVDGDLDFVATGKSTSLIAPVSASDRIVHWAKQKMQNDYEAQRNPALMRVLTKTDSREILETILRYSQASR